MVEVIVPFESECRHRASAWSWVRERYRTTWPTWRVAVASRASSSAWCKADAVMPAVERAEPGAICVVADADVWCPDIDPAVHAVAIGRPWAVPHHRVYRLTPECSVAVRAGARLEPGRVDVEQKPYVGRFGGGIVVARRETILEVPLDPRFTGWGQEDLSWALALRTLAGRPWRGEAPLFHFWHPVQRRQSRRWGSAKSRRLHARYVAARGKEKAMRRLLQEVNPDAPRPTDEPTVHPTAAIAD
jgi:hypothetical protein